MTPVANFSTIFADIFASQGAPPVSTTPVANFSTIFASVVDTGGKFASGVNNTGGKFAIGVNNDSGKLPPISTIDAKSTTQRCPKEIKKNFLIEDFFHLPPVSMTLVANLELQISPRIFKKILNDPHGIIRGLGEIDS
jgi:hypothetical protein